ncbi:MAG: PilT/PilU family type 4a pilus ATPase [Deltaproteobacteria bacterium]|nr:PilT/PilU family type 4a pilus ATPase [Deltaproteobacteria bacterium]
MALFRGSGRASKNDVLKRVLARDWKTTEDRSALLQRLGGFRDLKADELLPLMSTTDNAVRAFAEYQLKERLDPKSITAILAQLPKKTTRTQGQILNSLIRSRPELSIPHVQKLVSEAPSKDLAQRAMEALSALPVHQVGSEFVRFLSHERADIRNMALVKVAESKALIADKSIQNTIAGMGEDEDERIRLRVIDLVVQFRPAEAVRLCLERLKDPSPAVQQSAVRVMGNALAAMDESAEAEDQLLALLTDGSEAIRTGVIEIIMKRPDKDRILKKLLVFSKGLMGWVRDRTLATLRNYAADITQPIIRLMSDPDEDVRSMALIVGATLESREATPHIIGLLEDPDWWLRMTAAETLGKIGDPRAIPALIKAMEDPDTVIVCVEALSRMKSSPDQVLVPIAQQLSASQTEVRVEAVAALKRLGDRRVAPLLELAIEHDPSPTVQRRAAEALSDLTGDKRHEERLQPESAESEVVATNLHPIEKLLVQTREMGGSDLHIVVDSPASARLHGQLIELDGGKYTKQTSRAAIDPILDEEQRRLLQEHKQLDFCHRIPGVGRYRTNVYIERKGWAASFRVIPNEVPTLPQLGMPSHLADLVNYHQGLVVVAGPSGSGKSTTLAALVNLFNERRRSHLLSLEDPIEFVHQPRGCLINQRQVNKHTRSFAAALRGALRQDPDVIVVGDMRDPETVKLAIEASETGHLVIGTMNTTSAPKTVDRLIDAFPPSEQSQIRTMLSETLKVVVCQTLIPNAEGNGRVACFEVLMGTLGVSNLIRENKTYQIIGQMQIGEHIGHITVDTALTKLLDSRQITAEQAWLKAHNKDLFESRVSPEFLSGHMGA